MNKFRRSILLVCLLLFSSGCIPQQEEAKIVSSEKDVSVATVQDSTVSGRAEAGQTVKVVSKLSGKAAEVSVEMGSAVKKGQVLLRLDARDLEASVNAARASLENAQIAYKYALTNQQRVEQIMTSGAMSIADYENNYVSVLERSETAVSLAQANLDKAVITYEDSNVLAPINGTVTVANVKAGELVSSQIPVATIINLDEVQIYVLVNEKKINSLKLGQSFKVDLPAIPDKSFSGKITNISGGMDTASKAYPVKITVKNPGHLIKDGMFARVYL